MSKPRVLKAYALWIFGIGQNGRAVCTNMVVMEMNLRAPHVHRPCCTKYIIGHWASRKVINEIRFLPYLQYEVKVHSTCRYIYVANISFRTLKSRPEIISWCGYWMWIFCANLHTELGVCTSTYIVVYSYEDKITIISS